MSTGQIFRTDSTGSDATLDFAREMGRRMRGGEVIELVSDLGGGKTTFVRGLADGLGSTDKVHSPSFTISNEYHARDLVLHHFDFYRLKEPGILRDELSELLGDPKAVVAVEWAEIVEDVLPENRVTIRIRTTGENARELTCAFTNDRAYLFQAVQGQYLTS